MAIILSFLLLWPLATIAATPASSIAPGLWKTFNATIGGRLRTDGAPYARPCFEAYEGVTTAVNVTACSALQSAYTNAQARLGNIGSFTNPQWETCQATADGCLLDWQNPANGVAFQPPRECKLGSVAKYYIDARGPSDVQAAFRFAKLTGVRIVVKNTGHDYIGRSSAPDSLTVWTRNIQGLSYNPNFKAEGCSATAPGVTLGAGIVLNQLYRFAEDNGITVAGGTDRTVGAGGGWIQGGGHGLLTNTLGLGVDRVLQFKIVTTEGHYLTVNACKNQDLFWALRGGGGGTFGVVIETTFKAEPRPTPIHVFKATFPATTANWQRVVQLGIDNGLALSSSGWSGILGTSLVLLVNPSSNMTTEQAATFYQPFLEFAESVNGTVATHRSPSFLSFFDQFVGGNPVGLPGAPASRLVPKRNFQTAESRTSLFNALTNPSSLSAHFKQVILAPPANYPYQKGETSVTEAWRNSVWLYVTGHFWNFSTGPDAIRGAYAASSAAIQPLRDITPGSGTYHSEADVYEPDWQKSFWGSNYPRLLSIKKKYDPRGLLDCWHCVGWKGADDSRYQCYV